MSAIPTTGDLPAEVDAPSYYARHLADVNDTNAVISTEDIYNSHGALVVKKGTRISDEVASRVLQHKLLKPLHDQVQVERLVDGAELTKRLDALLANYPDLGTVIANNGAKENLYDLFLNSPLPALLAQHLTVLAQRRPTIFEKALFCTALAVAISWTMGLQGTDVDAVYVSGLVHDIGLLHIDPDVLDKSGTLTAQEWRAVQSHVVVGQMMLENLPGVCPRAARAVLEHHEQCDGSGYPTGKADDKLDPLGQIIAMADALQAIRVNQFASRGLNLANAIPYLHMNATTHFHTVYQAVHGLLKRSRLEAACANDLGDLTALANQLLTRGVTLSGIVRPLTTLERTMPELKAGRKGRALHRLATRLLRMLHSSGMLQDELALWLEQIRQREQSLQGALEDLNTIQLMQRELTWQVGSVRRALDEIVSGECDQKSPQGKQLIDALNQFNDCMDGLQA